MKLLFLILTVWSILLICNGDIISGLIMLIAPGMIGIILLSNKIYKQS